MNKRIKYDAIIIFESDFQKTIIDIIIREYYKEKNVLEIDARNFSIKIQGIEYKINLNGFKRTTSSFKDIIRFPRLDTKELLCTAFPGIGCRIFPALINYDMLVLIDDGSGTPAILKDGKYLRTLNLKIRFYYASIFTLLLKGHILQYTTSLIKKSKKYYTIYSFVDENYSKLTKGISIVHVNYFNKFKFTKVIKNQVGFVSSGLPHDKNNILKKIVKDCGNKVLYFPHPHEETTKIDKELVKKIVVPKTILEDYFMHSGIPEILYGEPSTVFINLRQSGYLGETNIFYVPALKNSPYYEIFAGLNINMIPIDDI